MEPISTVAAAAAAPATAASAACKLGGCGRKVPTTSGGTGDTVFYMPTLPLLVSMPMPLEVLEAAAAAAAKAAATAAYQAVAVAIMTPATTACYLTLVFLTIAM